MCIKINKVGKQEVGIWWVQKRNPQYGILIWRLWPNIRFLPLTVTEKNATKKILGRTEVKQYTPSPLGERGYTNDFWEIEQSETRIACHAPPSQKNYPCFSIFILSLKEKQKFHLKK